MKEKLNKIIKIFIKFEYLFRDCNKDYIYQTTYFLLLALIFNKQL